MNDKEFCNFINFLSKLISIVAGCDCKNNFTSF
jgi:hypothetical protein